MPRVVFLNMATRHSPLALKETCPQFLLDFGLAWGMSIVPTEKMLMPCPLLPKSPQPQVPCSIGGWLLLPSTIRLACVWCEERMIHVVGWYDNEWGYASRVADLASFISECGRSGPRPERVRVVECGQIERVFRTAASH